MRIPGTIVPDRMFTKFRYVDTVTLTGFTTPTETDSTLAFSYKDLILSIANPLTRYGVTALDLPAGLSLWSQFYNQMAVTSVRVKVTPISWINSFVSAGPPVVRVTGNPSLPYVVCLTPTSAAGLQIPTSATCDYLEQPYRKYKYFTQTQVYNQIDDVTGSIVYNAQSGNSVDRSLISRMTSKKMLGYKDLFDVDLKQNASVLDAESLWLPTEQTDPTQYISAWNYILTVKSTIPYDGVSTPDNYKLPDFCCRIEVDYSVAFRDRTLVAELS